MYFKNIDLENFWDESEHSKKIYGLPSPTNELIAKVEKELGYKLPQSYVELMKNCNGGVPSNTYFPRKGASYHEIDHICISVIMGSLVAAYNNNDEFEKAIDLSREIKENFEVDYKWYYRLGYTYFYNGEDTKEKAKELLAIAKELVDKTDDTEWIDTIHEFYDLAYYNHIQDVGNSCVNPNIDIITKVILKFLHGGKSQSVLKNGTLTKEYIGDLNLPTGKIVANDPLAFFEHNSFKIAVPSGSYPVFAHILHFETFGCSDKRVGFAEIKFNDNIPVRFKLAQRDDENGKNDYGVDSGTGGFMDLETDKLRIGEDEDAWEPMEKQLFENYKNTYCTTNYFIDETHNMILFSSGVGDGGYTSYFGYDKTGNICNLTTNFDVIDIENNLAFSNQNPFNSNYKLLEEMYADDYFPNFLVDKVKTELQKIIFYLEKDSYTRADIQKQLDAMTIAINELGEEFDENDSEIETMARDCIGTTVKYILEWFDIPIDVETAIAERDW